MSILTVNYDQQQLLERVNEGEWTRFSNLRVMELYYSDTHSPPGFYLKIGSRGSRLVHPVSVIVQENAEQLVHAAELVRPSPGEHCYNVRASIVVLSSKGAGQ